MATVFSSSALIAGSTPVTDFARSATSPENHPCSVAHVSSRNFKHKTPSVKSFFSSHVKQSSVLLLSKGGCKQPPLLSHSFLHHNRNSVAALSSHFQEGYKGSKLRGNVARHQGVDFCCSPSPFPPPPPPPCFNSSLPPHSSPFFWKSDLTVYSLFLFFGIPPIHYIIVAVVKWNVPVSLICLAVLCLSDNVCACSLIERRPAGRGAPACPDRRKSSPGKTIDGSASLYGRPMYPCLVVVESMHALEVSESGSPQI